MAEKRFILQGFTTQTHLGAVEHVFAVSNLQRALISVAFVNFGGVKLIEEFVSPYAQNTRVFAGIRNEITSRQGLEVLLGLGLTLVTVDTGSGHVLFHPKLYFARGLEEARVVIGSANLTAGGLNNNVEASVAIDLDLGTPKDLAFADSIENTFGGLQADFPTHVAAVPNVAHLVALQDAGRLLDESITRPRSTATGRNPRDDVLTRIKLRVPPIRPQGVPKAPPAPGPMPGEVAPEPAAAPPVVGGLPVSTKGDWDLQWESRELSERDLNIPTGANTSRTGSMLLKKGRLSDDVDFRDYFRDTVFSDLDWQHDIRAGREHLERAHATFNVIIKSVDYGDFDLQLTHNTDKTSATYLQRNSMTQLHWGDVIDFVRHADLLGRILYLYRDTASPSRFVIEID